MRHEEQRELWDKEHQTPTALKAMDSKEPSNSVKKFWDFLIARNAPHVRGIEMGCGKGRNVIWLAEQGVNMYGFDFSSVAIDEAKNRAAGVSHASFQTTDATKAWPYESA